MFNRTSPCLACPFRIDNACKFRFSNDRLAEIKNGTAFQCHRTLKAKPQQCAGLMSVLARERQPNQIMQVAERLGYLDLRKLDPHGEAYASWSEVLAALQE
jgi:hypothetical protein